jgi:probable HAF family extracellular repeat protein
MSMRRLFILCASALVVLPLAGCAAPKYSVTVVGAAGSSATGINASGTVIGDFPIAGNTHGFVNVAGVITDLGTLGGANSHAAGINNAGKIVGSSTNAAGNTRAFLYVAGVMTDLGTLGGPGSRAAAINNRDDIVGSADIPTAPGSYSSAFLKRSGALMQDLGRFEVPNTEGGSDAMDINDRRKIVGGSSLGPYSPPESPFHAFLYACEEMKDLGTLGGQFSLAYAINKDGAVVGEASTPEFRDNRAFLYHAGVMRNLGTLPGGSFSSARDINDKGQIVGFALSASGSGPWQKAWLYSYGAMQDLNALIDPALGWTLTDANGINNDGQIAATGCKAGVCHALRLDPAP